MKRYNDPYVVPPLEFSKGETQSVGQTQSAGLTEQITKTSQITPRAPSSPPVSGPTPAVTATSSDLERDVPKNYGSEFKPDFRNFSSVKKYKYTSPTGLKIAAGGILLFEETTQGKGVWVIEEIDMIKGPLYTDIGGRYNYDDGNIIATIAREFREETYNVHEIPYSKLNEVPPTQHLYVNGYDGTPSYLSIIAHVNQFDISFNPKEVKEKRKEILITNPDVPGDWYKTVDLKFLLLKDIIGGRHKISKRLYAILKSLSSINPTPKLQNPEINSFFKDFRY